VNDDLRGGEWEQEARTLHVEANGWIRGHYVPSALHTVREQAMAADRDGNRASLHMLHAALAKLEREIETYQKRMATFREQVGLLHALVLRARENAPDKSNAQLEAERHAALVAESDPGILGDDLLRRIAGYHRP